MLFRSFNRWDTITRTVMMKFLELVQLVPAQLVSVKMRDNAFVMRRSPAHFFTAATNPAKKKQRAGLPTGR